MADRVAIVTGAARGIGLATAKGFLAEGCAVALVDRDGGELERAVSGLDGEVMAVDCDVSIENRAFGMVSEVMERWGRVDHLVNNAGVADFGPIGEIGFDRWRKVMETNLDGVFLCSRAAMSALKESSGSIVNIASISGLRASTLRVAYGTSKAAVIQLTLQQAVELGEFGVRANAVCPGPVRTKLALAVHTREIVEAYHDAIPLNRYGSEKEIADVILFLCSDKAGYVTGQCVAVDGGFEAAGVGLPALRGRT